MRAYLLLILALGAPTALANPTGATVVSGTAQIQQNGSTLTIQNSANAIINWQSFSIGAGEVTSFVQPSSGSLVLNRVTGGAPSQLAGTLQSNGGVYLVNSSGVVFSAGAQVNTASFVATTREISDASFLAGTPFSGGGSGTSVIVTGDFSITGGVLNLGSTTITGDAAIFSSPNGTWQLETPNGASAGTGAIPVGGGVLAVEPNLVLLNPPGVLTVAPGSMNSIATGGTLTSGGGLSGGGTVRSGSGTVTLTAGTAGSSNTGALTVTGGSASAGLVVATASPATTNGAAAPVVSAVAPGSPPAGAATIPQISLRLQKREPLY